MRNTLSTHLSEPQRQGVPRALVAFIVSVMLTLGLAPGAMLQAAAEGPPTATAVSGLKVNGLDTPFGVSAEDVRLSWQLSSARRGVTQQASQIRIAAGIDELASAAVYDSGRVESADQVAVQVGAAAGLADETRYVWQVRVWDDTGVASEWSDPSWFETALPEDAWDAEWIGKQPGGIGAAWTDVTIDFTASDISGALGVYFRGSDGNNAYMWQLSEAENSLRPHVKANGGYSVLSSAPFKAEFDWSDDHKYRIVVSGQTITTSVDGAVVDTRTNSSHTAPGLMGFRTSGSETGTVHDLTVTSSTGEVLVNTDFTSDDVQFAAGRRSGDTFVVSGDAEAWVVVPEGQPIVRTDFEAADVASARLYASARGVYEPWLNGEPVGDAELAPGWTDYRTRIQYQTFDVTDLIRSGTNTLAAEIAPGWYSGSIAMFGTDTYGTDPSFIAMLKLTMSDGSTQIVRTDDTWSAAYGPRTEADLLHGETIDLRRAAELDGWTTPGFDASGWDAASVFDEPVDVLEPQTDQFVSVTQELTAELIPGPGTDTWLYDLGQNMVGRARITLAGKAGDLVTVRHGEVLNPDGSLYTANLRTARATDRYLLATDSEVTVEPSFTFHGFRYVEVSGVAEAPEVIGVVLGTDGDLVGDLTTNSALVNRLDQNINWGMRGNFLSIPTDTPARDERMGWTGDINVFARTAVYNMDAQAFLTKWLEDLRDTQRADGALPGVAPVVPGRFDGGYGSAGWMDAGVNVPWTLWQAYGDTSVIEDNLDMMTRYVEYLASTSNDGIRNVGGYNDWLNLNDDTPARVIDTAFVAKSAGQLAEMAHAIGADGVAADATEIHDRAANAFADEFISDDGTVTGDSQTAYILAITDDLVPDELWDAVAAQFVETLERRDWHLSTGFLGVDGLLPSLTAIGRTDIAYRLLQNTDYPSWGYEIGLGATTVWERWNSIMPDGSFGDVGMNSFNHYAYGAVGEWMYRTMAGVSAAEPGYARILIAPEPGAGIDHVDYAHETRYGTVRSDWQTTADGITMQIEIPAGTTATVRVPAPNRWAVTEGGIPAADAEAVSFLSYEDGDAVFEVGSGVYSFAIDATLGDLGAARAEVAELRAFAEGLTGPTSDAIRDRLGGLARDADTAWTAYVSDGDAAAAVHRALGTAESLAAWVDRKAAAQVDPADAEVLTKALDSIGERLSSAAMAIVGLAVSLDLPSETILPGDAITVGVVVDNGGDSALRKVAVDLVVPEGWTATRSSDAVATVDVGTSATYRWKVQVPADAVVGQAQLKAIVTHTLAGSLATIRVPASVDVSPAVVVTDVAAEPGEVYLGSSTIVTVGLDNRSAASSTRTVTLRLPDGWSADPVEVTISATSTESVEIPVQVGLAGTAGAVEFTAAIGEHPEEAATATVALAMTNPPTASFDHVDLGVPSSEQAHGLQASAASGTSVEAGLTRRYTNTSVPDGWFEFRLAVPGDEAFVVRAIETYDGSQRKDYTISMDGQVVFERDYSRSTAGTATFQFVVQPSEFTRDGTVVIRFHDTGTGYDPSIADVWSAPAIAGLDAPDDLAAGAAVTARSSLNLPPDWSTDNLVDGLKTSVAKGAKGYTSDTNTHQDGVDEWVMLDMGESKEFNTVVLYPRTETSDDSSSDGTDGAHFPKDYAIQVSGNGSDWDEVFKVDGQDDPGATPVSLEFGSVTARYVRIYVTKLGRPTVEEGALGYYRLQLAEVDVLNN